MKLFEFHKFGYERISHILLCADGSFYTGKNNDLELLLDENQKGEGAKPAQKRLPVELVYTEEYERV